jgi:quercetin dioxygenase-like cupin family protein
MNAVSPEQPFRRDIVLDTQLPAPLPTARVQVRRIEMIAGFAAGAHVHNGPVFGNIVSGTVRFQVAGQDEVVLRPGDVFYEPADVVIEHFDAREEDVAFIAYFPTPAGLEPAIDILG